MSVAKLEYEMQNWFSIYVMFLGLAAFDAKSGKR